MNRKIIMSWSKQRSFVAKTPENEKMAETLTEIDGIKDKSTSLTCAEGDKLQMYATGHELIAEETTDGDYELTFRVIEPDFELMKLLGLGTISDDKNSIDITTHVVDGYWSLKTEPKNIGATGIKAPKTKISYTPGYSEEDGNYADLKFKIIKGAANYWYSYYIKQAASASEES